MAEKEYLTTSEVAEILGVSESLIRKLIFKGEIPYLKIRSLIRFRHKDISEWVGKQQDGGSKAMNSISQFDEEKTKE